MSSLPGTLLISSQLKSVFVLFEPALRRTLLSTSNLPPPAILFRPDQDLTWSRESPRYEAKESLLDNSAESVFYQVSGQFQKQTEGSGAELEPEWVAEQAIIAKQAALEREPSVQESIHISNESIHTSSESEENQTSSDESEENPVPQPLQDPQPENRITQKAGSGLKGPIEHIDIPSEDYSDVPTIFGDQFSKSGFAMATPKGELIPLTEVTIRDVSIIYRDPQGHVNRQVYMTLTPEKCLSHYTRRPEL